MDPEVLPDVEDLWWSWAALAALHRAAGDGSCGFDPEARVLHLDHDDGSWVRMQHVRDTRATLFGRSPLAPEEQADATHDVPDWALSEAVLRRTPSFVAWNVRGEWDASAAADDEGGVHLLRPLLTVDPRVVAALKRHDLDADEVLDFLDVPGSDAGHELLHQTVHGKAPRYGGAVLTRLLQEVHQQMRVTEDRDRVLIQRPPALVQWARVHALATPFEHAVMLVRDELRPAAGNTPLPPAAAQSLTNVLHSLRREEAGEDSGAWLFARVWSDGALLGFDRAFDGWPWWWQVHHVSRGPTLADLDWEMRQRRPAWRPAWSTLLPADA